MPLTITLPHDVGDTVYVASEDLWRSSVGRIEEVLYKKTKKMPPRASYKILFTPYKEDGSFYPYPTTCEFDESEVFESLIAADTAHKAMLEKDNV